MGIVFTNHEELFEVVVRSFSVCLYTLSNERSL